MENKINLVEILKDCPEGMELDCTIYDGIVKFDGFNKNNPYAIRISVMYDGVVTIHTLTKYGQTSVSSYNKCVIFPKGKTTWEGFHKPFKDGDVLFVDCSDDEENKLYQFIFILKETGFYGQWHAYCYLDEVGKFSSKETYLTDNKYHPRFATKEEKEKLFDAIKSYGYKWNEETKTLEKLPKFKIGDEIKYKYPTIDTLTIIKVEYDKNRYVVCDKLNNYNFLSFFAQDNFNVIRKTKFDTSTLVPFDSRVLVRDNDYDVWRVAFWGYLREKQDIKYDTTRGVYRQCIPYEGNEHLLGKTDDCDEYYKTWL